jgi:hypothetical protein
MPKKYQALHLLFKIKIVVIKHEEQNCEATRKCSDCGSKHPKVETTETGTYAKNDLSFVNIRQ